MSQEFVELDNDFRLQISGSPTYLDHVSEKWVSLLKIRTKLSGVENISLIEHPELVFDVDFSKDHAKIVIDKFIIEEKIINASINFALEQKSIIQSSNSGIESVIDEHRRQTGKILEEYTEKMVESFSNFAGDIFQKLMKSVIKALAYEKLSDSDIEQIKNVVNRGIKEEKIVTIKENDGCLSAFVDNLWRRRVSGYSFPDLLKDEIKPLDTEFEKTLESIIIAARIPTKKNVSKAAQNITDALFHGFDVNLIINQKEKNRDSPKIYT